MFIMSKQKDELLKNPLYEILVFPVDGMNIAAIPFSEIIFSRKETESEYIFSAKISKDQIEKFYDYHGSVKGITVYAANKIFPGIEFLAKFVLKRTDDAYKKINISGYGKEINVHLSKLSHLWSVDVNVIGEEEKRSESMNKENSIKSDNKCKQIIIYNKDTKEQHTGILLNDGNVICGCCGGLFEYEDKGITWDIVKEYDDWVSFSEEIIE